MITKDNACCRYCCHCSYGDIAYCSEKKKTMSDNFTKSYHKCKDFSFNEIDVFDINKTYKPKAKVIHTEDKSQIKMF